MQPGDNRLEFSGTSDDDIVVIGAPAVTFNGIVTTYARIGTLDLNTLGGLDTVTVNPETAGFPRTVNIDSGDDDDQITVNLMAGATAQINIVGGEPSASDSVTVNGTPDADAIDVNGLAVTFGDTVVALADVENVTVAGGGGGDALSLTGESVTGNLTLLGQADDDVITLDYPITTGTLSVDGGDGTADRLDVNLTAGEGTDIVTVDSAAVQITGQTTTDYFNFEMLNLSTGGGADAVTIVNTHLGTTLVDMGTEFDTVNVRSISGQTTLDLGDGNDIVNVSSVAPASLGTLLGISADLIVIAGEGIDELDVDNQGDAGVASGNLSSTQLTGLGMASGITYDSVENLSISLGAFGDSFTIESTFDGTTMVLNTGDGEDIIEVGAINGPTTIYAGDGSDTIHVTPPAEGPVDSTLASPVNSSAINGLLTVVGGEDAGDLDQMNFTFAFPSIEPGNLTSTRLTGLQMPDGITYFGLEDLNIALVGGAAAGDTLTVTDGITPQTIVLTQTQIDADEVLTTFAPPAEGDVITVTATVTDAAGNTFALGSDAATRGETATTAPGVTITEDANNDGFISADELAGDVNAIVVLAGGAAAGDTLTVTDGITPQTIVLTQTQIDAGEVLTTFAPPASGVITVVATVTDAAGNTSAMGSDAATRGETAATAPGVTITEDANNDGFISADELVGDVNVTVGLPGGYEFTIESTHIGTSSLTTGARSDTVNVLSTAGETTIDTAGGNDTINIQSINAATEVNSGADNDTINVGSLAPLLSGGTVNGIAARLEVRGEADEDTLNVDDTGDTVANIGILSATELTGLGMSDGIGYETLEHLNIGLGSGGHTFTIESTHAGTTTLNTDAADDTVHVLSTSGETKVDTGAGQDTVNVQTIGAAATVNVGSGNDAINVGSLAPAMGGTVNDISAPLTVNGENGNDTLNVDDTGDTDPNTGTLTAAGLTGLGMSPGIAYDALETLNIALGSSDDALTVESVHQGVTNLSGNGGEDKLAVDPACDFLGDPITFDGGAGTDTVLASRDADFTLSDSELALSGVGSVLLQSVESASLVGGDSANKFTFTGWTGSATVAGRAGDDRYVFNAAPGPAAYTMVELPAGGDDIVDFIAHGPDHPAQALDWMNPGGSVTPASLAWHPDVGSVSVGAEAQQLNIEYGLNVRVHLDAVDNDAQGVSCEPIPTTIRFVDVGTKMAHTAVIDWGDGRKEDPATVIEGPTLAEGFVESVHAFTELGTYDLDVTVTDHSPGFLWPTTGMPWDTSATVSARVEVFSAVVKEDPQRPGEQALFVGGSLGKDKIRIGEYRSGDIRVNMNHPRRRELFRRGVDGPTEDGHIYVFTGQGNDLVKLDSNVHHDAEIYAGPGNDVLIGGRGNDKLDGHQGNDRLYGKKGNDHLVGGPGKDRLCGNSGNDVLQGPDAVDFYYRSLVDDLPVGGDGADRLYGGSGNDVIEGGSGNDRLYGDRGNDHLSGGDGHDRLYGSSGNDVIEGGSGNDRLYGDRGNDHLSGGDGHDRLYGSSGNDVIEGGPGDDRLYGSRGRDLLIGGLGADHVYGQSNDDIVIGGTTDYDAQQAALWAIMAEWSRLDLAIDARIDNLKKRTGLNAATVLTPGGTVNDDAKARDKLFDGSGDDWFLYFDPDSLYSKGRKGRTKN